MKKKTLVGRHEHELIIILLVVLTISVITLAFILKDQNKSIKDTQVLLQENAEASFDINDVN